MKHIFAAAVLAGVAFVGVAPAFAEDECPAVAADKWISEAQVREVAAKQGWTVSGLDHEDGCWEVKGTDGAGKRVEAYLNPATGDVVKMKD